MSKQHEHYIGPVTGTGRNKTEARRDAITKAGQALAQMERGPIFVIAPPDCGDDVIGAMVFPTPHGWAHRLVHADGFMGGWTLHGNEGWMVVTLAAVVHLADLALDGTTEKLAKVLAWLGYHVEVNICQVIAMQRDNLIAEIRRKHVFIAAYNAAREQGLSDQDAHAQATIVTE